ncbi:MAG: SH3 domain-containing protein [Pseudomonadota bacterium]
MAVLTEGQVLSEDLGMKLENTELDILGRAKRAIITKDDTTLVLPRLLNFEIGPNGHENVAGSRRSGKAKTMIERTVRIEHVASYPNPIILKKDGGLKLTGREEIWDGHRWLWAIAPNGKEGWIPDDLPRQSHNELIASHDYSAVELSCAPGESVL